MKRLVSAIVSMALLLGMTACAGSESPVSEPSPPPAQPSVQSPAQSAPQPPAPAAQVEPLQVWKDAGLVYEWDDNYNNLTIAQWENLTLGEALPHLADVLDSLNRSQADYAENFAIRWRDAAAQAMSLQPEYFGGFTCRSAYTVQRADSLILSIREDFGDYTGGAHSNYGAQGLNYRTADGALLTLQDVLQDTDPLPELVAQALLERYPQYLGDELAPLLAQYTAQDWRWTMDYQGITFYFSPYEIAPFAAGLLTATLWFDQHPQLIREEYRTAPEGGWAMALPVGFEVEVDLNPEDGRRNVLSCWGQNTAEGYVSLGLSLDQQLLQEDSITAFAFLPVLFCVEQEGAQRFYLCVQGQGEQESVALHVYDLNGESPRYLARYPGCSFPERSVLTAEGEVTWYTQVPNHPRQLTLDTPGHLLGRATLYRPCRMAFDGTLQPLSDHYQCYDPGANRTRLTTAIPLEVTLLPEGVARTLPAGTQLTCLRTDNADWVELGLEGGGECRILITYTDGVPTINGVPCWDCFETLMNAR